MIGIGIPIYNDIINTNHDSIDMYNVVCSLIESIDAHTQDEFLLVIRDNNSLDFRFNRFHVTLSQRFSRLNVTFISDSRPSLTDGWNRIIEIAIENGCESIVLTNQDVIVTKYWQNFINLTKLQSNDLFSPLMTDASYQPLQMCNETTFRPEDILIQVPIIQGCCFGGSKKAFEENMYDTKNYFDPSYEFGYNEIEWQLRNKGKSYIVKNSMVIHLSNYSWAGIENSNKKNPIHKDRDKILNTLNYHEYSRGLHVG